MQEGTLTNNIGMFLFLIELCGDHGGRNGHSSLYPSLLETIESSVELHNFLLFAGIFLKGADGDVETHLLFAISIATKARRQPNRLASLSTAREELKAHPSALSSRLKEILRGYKKDSIYAFRTVITAISWLTKDEFYVDFDSQDDLVLALASAYWHDCVSVPGGQEAYQVADLTLVLIGMLSDKIPSTSHTSGRGQSVGRLLAEYDLLSLVEKVMVNHTTALPEEPINNWSHVSRLLLYNRQALGPPLRRDFLTLLDYLRTVDTVKGRHLLDMWLYLGSAAVVHEKDLRDERDRERKAEQGGLGCSWLRCAMYEQDSVKDVFFMCSACHEAMYCGPSCQDRDWREGGHAAKCRKSTG